MKNKTLFVLFICVLAIGLCGSGAKAAGPEVKIWNQIKSHLNAKQYRAACELALKMQPYKETETYAIADKQLTKIGISLGDPLGSFTLLQIIALQNHTEAIRARTGRLPEPGPRPRFEDGWYRPLRIEQLSRKTFAYLIRSAGADGIWMSNDDYVIGQRRDAATRSNSNPVQGKNVKQGVRDVGRKSMYTGQRKKQTGQLPGVGGSSGGLPAVKSSGGTPKSTSPGEKQVTIDDLLTQ